MSAADEPRGAETVADLVDELDELARTAPTAERRDRLERATRRAADLPQGGTFGRTIVGFDRTDASEAFFGAVLFGIPMFVEGGTQEVGAFVATRPAFLAATFLGAVGLVIGILYVAEFQDVRIHRPLFGVVPRRLLGVVVIAFLTATAVMTGWGRVDWADPLLALGQVCVAFVPMAIGAALGDILPGS